MSTRNVRVDLNRRGDWDVELSDQDSRMTCETLEEAERVAHICAAYKQPCELVVCDAYHRVLRRELVDTRTDQARPKFQLRARQASPSPISDALEILDARDPPSIAPRAQRPQSQQATGT